MDFQCFSYYGEPLVAELAINSADGVDQIRCIVRDINSYVTPEEKVRQSFLWFLIHGSIHSEKWKKHFTIYVERFDIDIALSFNFDIEGFDTILYFLLVETKKVDYVLFDDQSVEDQLKKYLLRKNCTNGLLFNACSAIYLKLDDKREICLKQFINDFKEIDDIIVSLIESQKKLLIEHKDLFCKAKNGDFESFKILTGQYGKKCTIKFEYEKSKNIYQARGFLFAIEGENISYKIRGITTKRKQIVNNEMFRKLVYIKDTAW